jgi:hypothetical protein
MFVRLFIQKSVGHLFCVFVFEAMHIWLAAEASYMMYTHVERRRRSIICRPAAQGDHRGGKAGSAGRARAAPLWVYRVRPSARPPARRGVRAAAPTGRGRDSCGLWAWRGLARTASLSRNSNGGQPHPQRVAGAQAEPPRGLPTARVDQPASQPNQTKARHGNHRTRLLYSVPPADRACPAWGLFSPPQRLYFADSVGRSLASGSGTRQDYLDCSAHQPRLRPSVLLPSLAAAAAALHCIAAVHTGPHMRRVLSCRGCSLCVCTVAGSPHPQCRASFPAPQGHVPLLLYNVQCLLTLLQATVSVRAVAVAAPIRPAQQPHVRSLGLHVFAVTVKDSRLVLAASGRRRGRPFCCTVAIILLRKVPASLVSGRAIISYLAVPHTDAAQHCWLRSFIILPLFLFICRWIV